MMTALAIAVFTLLFLAIHLAVTGRYHAPFHLELKISRGLAALLLTSVGFYSLIHWFFLWPKAFLDAREAGSVPFYFVCFIVGHLMADFLWLAWGQRFFASSPRTDLILHHLLGLAACVVVFAAGHGHILLAVALTTEMMPMLTGLEGWASLTRRPRIAYLAPRFRLAVLLGWRIPLWFVLLAVSTYWITAGTPETLLTTLYWIAVAGSLAILTMDAFWARQMLVALRNHR